MLLDKKKQKTTKLQVVFIFITQIPINALKTMWAFHPF